MPERRSLRRLNVTELAEVAGLSPGQVSLVLNRAGIAPAEIDGKRKLFDAPQALRQLLGSREHDPAEERAALDATKREMLELQLAQKRLELIPADEVRQMLIELATSASARLQAIPTALALELATESDPSRCKAMLKAAIDDALNDLAAEGRREAARATRALRGRRNESGHGDAAKPERGRVGHGKARRAARDDTGAGALAE